MSPSTEGIRLEALHRYDPLEFQGDGPVHDLVALAASICRTPLAWMGLMDRDRLLIKSSIGLPAKAMPRRGAFAADAICRPHDILEVSDARHDARFSKNPLVAGEPHVRFWAGAPLVELSGQAIGILSVMDTVPRVLSDPERLELRTLAKLAVAVLELRQTEHRLNCEILERAQYERRVAVLQQQLKTANARLEAASMTDSLTQIGNRRAFDEHLAQEMNRVKRQSYPLSLLMIDIDHFKLINDTMGHPAGDQVIRCVAEVIRHTIRVTDYVARVGGDEFMVILPATDQVAAATLAERCRRAVESSSGPDQPVRVSIGVTQLSQYTSDAAELIAAVDQCLLRAKRAGSNRVWHQSARERLF
jgi:diguanylate cyclase (GGDEF)-like protein